LNISNNNFYNKSITNLKNGIWLYFILLVFEGSLRKWILPQFSAPLLLVRDPLVIYLFISASFNRIIFFNSYIFYAILIVIISFIATMLTGHGNVFVAIYGARIFLIHFPMIFLIGSVFNKEDVIKMGIVILYISIPMSILIGFQFFSPQNAWVNKGIGDSIGGGFSGAMGYLRPPGTFSFTSGVTSYFSLVAVFVMYFWIENSKINKIVLLLASIALLFTIPFSISRSLLFQIVISFIFTIIGINWVKGNSSIGVVMILGFTIILFFSLKVFSV
jgi:hypothetical protein